MTEDKKQQLAAIKRRIEIANKFRLGCLFAAVVVLLCDYFGKKVFEAQVWFQTFLAYSYTIVGWILLVMLVSVFVRIYLVSRHNKIVKSL